MPSLTILGCGDAFSSGGHLHTCFFLQTPEGKGILLDCGATVMTAFERQGMRTDDVDAMLISHFHNDHYGGIPIFLIQALKLEKRSKPLLLCLPKGGEEQVYRLLEATYPGTGELLKSSNVEVKEYPSEERTRLLDTTVTAYPVIHAPLSNPHGVRIETKEGTLAFSGDTEWTEKLKPLSDGADLFICECNFLAENGPAHLSHEELLRHQHAFRCGKMQLTHMGPEVLKNRDKLAFETLQEGKTIRF